MGAVFSTDMEMRPIAYQYQSYWTDEPMIHFAVMDYSVPDTGMHMMQKATLFFVKVLRYSLWRKVLPRLSVWITVISRVRSP